MDTPTKKSFDSSKRFSLGEIGLKQEENEKPELQSIRETSIIKRGSIIRELSNISSLYSTYEDAYCNENNNNHVYSYTGRSSLIDMFSKQYDEKEQVTEQKKHDCCIIS